MVRYKWCDIGGATRRSHVIVLCKRSRAQLVTTGLDDSASDHSSEDE
jgi:hypothetical protein